MNNKTVIISFYENQYLYFYYYYHLYRIKNIEYYFLKKKKKNFFKNFKLNLKKSISNKKIISLILYYFFLIIFNRKFSSIYKGKLKKKLKEKFLIENKINVKIIDDYNEIILDKNNQYNLILFGCDYVSKSFYSKFLNKYNVHFGLLPKYKGLRAIERMFIDEIDPYVSINEISDKIDQGRIIYKEKIKNIYYADYFNKFILNYELAFDIVYKLINNKLKLNNIEGSHDNIFFGFEFNEIKYKKLLQKINAK